MTILRYYLPSANTFTFNFTSHISFHGSFSLLLLLFQIHSNPLIFSRSKIIFDPPSYIVSLSHLPFHSPASKKKYIQIDLGKRSREISRKKRVPRNDVDSSRCSPKSFLLPTQYHPPFSRWTFADSRLVRAGNSLALTFNRHLTFSLLRVSGDGGNDEEREMKRERERERVQPPFIDSSRARSWPFSSRTVEQPIFKRISVGVGKVEKRTDGPSTRDLTPRVECNPT